MVLYELQHSPSKIVSTQKSVVDAIVALVSESPWYAAAVVGGSCLSVLALFAYCCCRSSASMADSYNKKTDDPVPDTQTEDDDALLPTKVGMMSIRRWT